ncbi:hypothetical protein [Parachlamydia sp. AcF125]|uniref:hypothetical protein n=1 Tax=Parachlamydia sp. AcF125 TaxID=2795736 RepID=UPI001BC99F35|nr:hypothetical protein [Parachlamydia sp. AcF125]MBS4167830.1 hypothetical protein [Parachlamydia sp. AcF125]
MTSIKKAFENQNLNEMNIFLDMLEVKIGFLGSRKWFCKGYQGSISLNYLFAKAVEKTKNAEAAADISRTLTRIERLDQIATLKLKQTKLAKFFHFIPHFLGKFFFNRSKAKRLLKARINAPSLHNRNTLGETLLHEAIRDSRNHHDVGFIKFLISQGVRPFYPVIASEEDPITLALSLNLLEIAEFLFKNALSKKQISADQTQALLLNAVRLQNATAVKLFLDHGAKKNKETIKLAKKMGNKEILALMQC